MSEIQDSSAGDLSSGGMVDARIAELESTLRRMQESIERQDREIEILKGRSPALPDTRLLSPQFLTRAFAVWGHYFVANLLLVVPIVCLMALLALVLGLANY